MKEGDINEYLKRAPEANRPRLVSKLVTHYCPPHYILLGQAMDVAEGLSYLHEHGIIHGDLKGVSYLFFVHTPYTETDHMSSQMFSLATQEEHTSLTLVSPRYPTLQYLHGPLILQWHLKGARHVGRHPNYLIWKTTRR